VFEFGVNQHGSPWAIYEPGADGTRRRDHAGSWDYVFRYAEQWVQRIKEEHEAPDLWRTLEEQGELIAGPPIENTPFTPTELEHISATLSEAKEYARANLELDPQQLQRIEDQLDYLVEAAERVGRLDWRNLVVGSLLALVLQAIVPVGPIQQLFIVAFRSLVGLFGGPGQPELPGGVPPVA